MTVEGDKWGRMVPGDSGDGGCPMATVVVKGEDSNNNGRQQK